MCRNVKLLAIIIVTLSLTRCVETIDLNPSGERKVVLNCILTNSKTQTLTLNYSSLPNEKYYNEITAAKIKLFEGNVFVGEFQKTGYARWLINYTPKAGMTYKIEVEIANQPLITATTIMPEKIKIRKLKALDVDKKKYFEKDSCDIFWAFAFEKPEDIIMHQTVIDKRFKLLNELATNYQAADHFNIQTAIATSITNKTHLAYIRMLPDVNQKQFFLEGNLYSCVIVFRTVSDDYDRYLKSSLQKMLVYEAFDDPSQWLDENEIYTNVQNGIGIFGAYSDVLFNYNISMPDE